jgi:hypothetical protein
LSVGAAGEGDEPGEMDADSGNEPCASAARRRRAARALRAAMSGLGVN